MRVSSALEDSPVRRFEHLAVAAVAAGLDFIAGAAVGDTAFRQGGGRGGGRDGGDEEGGEEVDFGEEHGCGAVGSLARSREKEEEGEVL